MYKTAAFSLLDLIASVAIIGLLAMIVIPSISGSVQSTNAAVIDRQIQELNLALEHARIRKDNPVLYSGSKYEVYDYLVEHGFIIPPAR